MSKLNALKVKSINKIGMHSDGNGLYLKVQPSTKANSIMLTFFQRKDGCKELTVHGFRSSFRDWAAEKGNFSREVCEQALAHALKDQTEAAYQRATFFDKRVELMQAWANYCFGIDTSQQTSEAAAETSKSVATKKAAKTAAEKISAMKK